MTQPLLLKTAYSIDECHHRLQETLSARVTTKLWGITLSDHRRLYGRVTDTGFRFRFLGRVLPVYLTGTLTSATQGTVIQVHVRFPHYITFLAVFLFGLGGFVLLVSTSLYEMGVSLFLFVFGVGWLISGLYAYNRTKPRLIQHLKVTLKATPS